MFLSFLDVAGFAVVPEKDPRRYRVVSLKQAITAPEPVYIGVDPETLPDSDQIIRYVYFVENGNMEVIQSIVESLRSSSSNFVALGGAKAFILTDKSYNIKTLMVIIKEFDRVSIPQSMSVIKLRRADAKEVKTLLQELMGIQEDKYPMFMPPRQQPTALFFPQNTRIIAETRTNSLIVLGSPDGIERIQNFVRKVDGDPETPYSPLFYYDLKYADATTVKNILEETVGKFGKDPETEAGKVGGLRGIDKYVKPMTFIADTAANRIITRGEYQDYLMVEELIRKIDEPQPQIALEVLVLAVNVADEKILGAALRSKADACNPTLSKRVQFQTSGLGGQGLVERTPTSTETSDTRDRLMGNLLNLVKGLPAGSSVLTFGRDLFGVWGIMQALQTFSTTQIVANPFLVTSNKQKASVSVGEVRRVVTSTVVGGNNQNIAGFDNDEALLSIEATPQINSDGMITLDLRVALSQFRPESTASSVAKLVREVVTKAIVADQEVLAIGGLIQNRAEEATSKVPILGDLPLIGWLFKNKNKTTSRDNLLVLLSAKVIDPLSPTAAESVTEKHVDDYYAMIDGMHDIPEKRDPVNRMFFAERDRGVTRRVENYIFEKPRKRLKKVEAAAQAKIKQITTPSSKTTEREAPHILTTAAHENQNTNKRHVSLTSEDIFTQASTQGETA